MARNASIYGLVLAGGASTRMLRDKAALSYHGKPQLQWSWELLDQRCQRTFISGRADQANHRDSRPHLAAVTTASQSPCAQSTSRRAVPPSARMFRRASTARANS